MSQPGSDSNPSSPFRPRPLGSRSTSGPLNSPAALQHSTASQDDPPFAALEAGVSPIGGVYYAATPTSLHFPEQQQQQQQQQAGNSSGLASPASPGGASSSSSNIRRPSPGRVRKPVFGVKGAYSSMAARRYAAALAASGHADPDVLAEAIRAAAAEAEGNRAGQLAAAEQAAAMPAPASSSSTSTSRPLHSFGSTPTPAGHHGQTGSSSRTPQSPAHASGLEGKSEQLAGLVSPRLLANISNQNPFFSSPTHAQQQQQQQQHQQQQHVSSPTAETSTAPAAGSSRHSRVQAAANPQQMSPKTPIAPDLRAPDLHTPTSIREAGGAFTKAGAGLPGHMGATSSNTSPDWPQQAAAAASWPTASRQEQPRPQGSSDDDWMGVPVASGVVGTQVRKAMRWSSEQGSNDSQHEQQQQQQQQQARGRGTPQESLRMPSYMMPTVASAAAASARANSATKAGGSLTRAAQGSSRSPSPTFSKARGLPSSGVVAAAAAAAAASGVMVGMVHTSVSNGAKGPGGAGSSQQQQQQQHSSPLLPATSVISLQDELSQTEATSSTAALQQQQEIVPSSNTPHPAVAAGAGALAGSGAAAAAAAAAPGPSSRPLDISSMQGSSSSTPLSQQWQSPAGTGSNLETAASGSSTPWMTPFGSRSGSFANPAAPTFEAGPSWTQPSQQQQQLQQQQQEQAQQQQEQQEEGARPRSSQGGILGSLWSYFSGGSRGGSSRGSPMISPRDNLTGGPSQAAAAAAAGPSSSQGQQPIGWSSGTTAAGAGAAAAAAVAAAAATAGGYAVSAQGDAGHNSSSHHNSSGHYSLDPTTGLVVNSSPVRPSPVRTAAVSGASAAESEEGRTVTLGGGLAPGGGSYQGHTAPQPTYLQSLEEMHPDDMISPAMGSLSGGVAAAAAATLYGSPGPMGHGHPPGHTVFAPGALHHPPIPYGSYTPVVAAASTGSNGSGSTGLDMEQQYPSAAAAGVGMGVGAAAAAAGAGAGTSGTVPALGMASGGLYRQHLAADSQALSDISSMFSNPSSYGEPLQPQRLPPATWPAEALPSPTGSDSMHSAFDPDSPFVSSCYQHSGDIQGFDIPKTQASLESSGGGAEVAATSSTAAAAAAVAAGAAALAAGAARKQGGRSGGPSQAAAQVDQPSVRVKLDASGPQASSSPRRRSKVSKEAAGAGVSGPQEQRGRESSSGGNRRLGALLGVSSWEGRKTGKQADPSVPSPEATPRPSKERKRRTGGGAASSRVKRQRAVCILVPLAILLVLGGIGAAIGITMSQQRAALAQPPPAAAEAAPPPPPLTAGPPLVFKVNVTVPPGPDGQPGPSCADLVGPQSGKGKMESYLSTFRQAYARALNISATDVKVGSLACDGQPVSISGGAGSNASKGSGTAAAPPNPDPAAKPPPTRRRALLDAMATGEGQAGTRSILQAAPAATPAVLTTEFSVPAPAEPAQRAELASAISEMSPQILAPSLTELFGRPVEVEPAVQQQQQQQQPPRPQAPRPSPSPAIQRPAAPPPPPPLPSPSPPPVLKPPAPPSRINVTTPPKAAEEPAAAASPAPVAPDTWQSPQGSPALTPIFPGRPQPSPRPPRTAAPRPQPQPSPAPSPQPTQRPGGTWGLLPIFRPTQPPRPHWPFGQPKPAPPPEPPSPPVQSLSPSPSPVLALPPVGPEEATPVIVTLSPSPLPKPSPAPSPPPVRDTFVWPGAPACRGKPNGHTAVPDAEGRLWGWQDGQSCAYRTAGNAAITITWENAVSCGSKPTTSNSVYDQHGRLWGWQEGRSCAYRGSGVQAPPAPGQVVVTWDAAPACAGVPDARNSVRNPQGQLWGWENGSSCAFRIQNGANTITWATAPVCKGSPNHYTAVRDKLGRLWGWEDNESCRFTTQF